VMPKRGAFDARDFARRRRALLARSSAVRAEAGKRIAGARGILAADLPHEVEEEGKRAWQAFMLQRTMLR